jgi:hypothetical protein
MWHYAQLGMGLITPLKFYRNHASNFTSEIRTFFFSIDHYCGHFVQKSGTCQQNELWMVLITPVKFTEIQQAV